MLSAISVSGANSLLVVTGDASWADREGAHFPGTCAVVAMTELLSGNLASEIDPAIKFDLCLCELGREQLFSFDNLANAVKPAERPRHASSAFTGTRAVLRSLPTISCLL